jgi:hypothetical protein
MFSIVQITARGCSPSVQDVTLKTQFCPLNMNPFTRKAMKPTAVKRCPAVAADALLEIGTAVISAVLSLDEHLSKIYTFCFPEVCYHLVHCCLIRYGLSRNAVLNAYLRAENECSSCGWPLVPQRSCRAY